MTIKHTPGKWKVSMPHLTIDGSLGYIATISNYPNSIDDAYLMSAAPELLAACKYVIQYCREHDSGEGELYGMDFVTTCINAVRKAERK